MKITLTKAALRDAVPGLGKVVPTRTNLAVLNCVRFAVTGDSLTATATDLDQTLVCRFEGAQCEGSGEIIVPYAALRELAKGDATDTVALEQDGDSVIVTNVVGGHAGDRRRALGCPRGARGTQLVEAGVRHARGGGGRLRHPRRALRRALPLWLGVYARREYAKVLF